MSSKARRESAAKRRAHISRNGPGTYKHRNKMGLKGFGNRTQRKKRGIFAGLRML